MSCPLFFGFRRSRTASTLRRFHCSGGVNPPCAEVFASGENARTAQKRRPLYFTYWVYSATWSFMHKLLLPALPVTQI